ncbi:hypothetical protein ACFOYW_13810 [Gryllotalpicola reticulitermitis]|uniref:Uncharacterized protein n=1 Tax=Gryllotalpicola reticulitermitis TaxID=1184153 RepID=A0ABV8QAT9_9MICO
MDKSDNDNGVSRSGDAGTGDDDSDPDVTAISRKLDDTGDTLGAIQALEQLIIERTGAIPIITAVPVPEPGPTPTRAPEPEPATTTVVEAESVAPAEVAEPAQVAEPANVEVDAADIDWSLPEPTAFDDEPGFSAWVDPEQIAAAYDSEPKPSYSDVSTQVFAVFSADRSEPEPPPEPTSTSTSTSTPESEAPTVTPAPEPESTAGLAAEAAAAPEAVREPSTSAQESVTISMQLGSLDVTPQLEPEDSDDDVVDDLAGAALAGLTPMASAPEALSSPPRRRRFWFFGRR